MSRAAVALVAVAIALALVAGFAAGHVAGSGDRTVTIKHQRAPQGKLPLGGKLPL